MLRTLAIAVFHAIYLIISSIMLSSYTKKCRRKRNNFIMINMMIKGLRIISCCPN